MERTLCLGLDIFSAHWRCQSPLSVRFVCYFRNYSDLIGLVLRLGELLKLHDSPETGNGVIGSGFVEPESCRTWDGGFVYVEGLLSVRVWEVGARGDIVG